MKQETLEKAAEKYANLYYDKNSELSSVITESIEWSNRNHNFIEGAKWLQEKLLSFDEEELVKSDNDKLLFQIGILRGMLRQREILYNEEDLKEAFENGVGSGKYQEKYGDNAKGSMSFEYFIGQFKNEKK